MKKKQVIQSFLILLLLFILSDGIFAIQGGDSSGIITSYSGITGVAVASGSSSDSGVSGGRVSVGSSAVSSGYSDGTTSGNPGIDLSTSDPQTQTASSSGTNTNAEASTATDGGLNNIPSSGGSEGAAAIEGSSPEATEAVTVEQTTGEAQTTTEAAAFAENAITVAIEMSEGAFVPLAPQTGAAGISVLAITATTATVVITHDGENSITGGVIYSADQETTMEIKQTIDVDSDGDGVADLQITLSQIDYNVETEKYEGVFTLTYLDPSEEVVSFVKEQLERGEVTFVKGPALEEISFTYWVWIIIGVFVVGVLAFIGWMLFDKRNKKYLPATMPTHYFEKLVRQEVSTHKKEELQEVKTQEIKKEEVKKELAQKLKKKRQGKRI